MLQEKQVDQTTKSTDSQQEADITDTPRTEASEDTASSSAAVASQGQASGTESQSPPSKPLIRRRGALRQQEYRDDRVLRWIFLCFPPVRDLGLTEYVQQSIKDVTNDTELFEAMQREYRMKRGSTRFFRLEGVKEIKFIQVTPS